MRSTLFAVVVRLASALVLDRSVVPLGRDLLWSAALMVGLVVLIGVLSLLDFDALWTRFHQIAFRNGLWLLDPSRNRLWLQTVSHKALRLLGPLFLAAAAAANLMLLDRPFYRLTLGAQVVFYVAALVGYASQTARNRVRLVGVAYVFCLLYWATVVAFVRFVAGRQRVTWDRAGA